MADIAVPSGGAPSAPSTGSTSSTPSTSSQPSTQPSQQSPVRQTTAELSDKLFDPAARAGVQEPAATSQHEAAPEANDYSWLDPYKDGVHGVPVQDLLQALSEGRLPDELHEKLFVTLQDGEQTYERNIAQTRNEHMMRQKFSQLTGELSNERKQFHSERDQFINDLRSLKSDPEMFLHSMSSMGMPVLEAAQLLATRMAQRDFLNQQALGENWKEMIAQGHRGPGDDWYEGIEAKQKLAQIERQQQRQKQAQQEQQQKQQFTQRQTAVQSTALEAFQKTGIDVEKHPQYWDRASYHLQRIYDAKPEPRDGSEKPLTRRDVYEAVRTVKDEIDAFHKSYGSQPAAPAAPKPGASALDTRAGKAVPERAPKQQQARKTTEEVAREMRDRQGVRVR